MGRVIVEVNLHELTEFLKEGSEFKVTKGLPADAVIEDCTFEGITASLIVSSATFPDLPDLPKQDIQLNEFTRRTRS